MGKGRIMLLLASILVSINGERRPPLKLEGNGYVNLIVALSDNGESPHEVDQLVSGLSVLLEEGSRQLYMATRKTFYLHNVTILLPTSWQFTVWKPSDLSASQSHIGIGFEDEDYDYVAYVNRDPNCGARADLDGNMQITKKFVKASLKNETRRRLFAKTLVHEFGHYLFGIYDEYGDDYVQDGKTLRTQCTGNMKVKTRQNCEPTVWNSLCEIIDNPNGSHYASLMDTQYHEEVTEFCDNNTGNPNTLHNVDAPSKQNLFCDEKSSWEVIRDHQDYKDVLNSTEETIYQPPFLNIVRSNIERAVLVFDKSGSMTECKISVMYEIVRHRFQYSLENIEFVGVVWFSSKGFAKTTYLRRMEDVFSPNELDSLIPKAGSGSTSIGAGILAALDLLKKQPNVTGGRIYVVTDGEENTLPKVEHTLQQVKDYGAIVSFQMTIEGLLSDKNSGSYKLAQATGGYVIDHPYCQLTPEVTRLRQVFFSAFTAPGDLYMHNEVTDIKKHTHVVTYFVEYTPIKRSVMIEESLGRHTLFEFRPFYWKKANISWIIVSPNGKRYTESSPCNEAGPILHSHICVIEQEHFQPGMWHFEVMSNESVPVVTLVQSKWSKRGKYPVMMTALWQKPTLTITADENNEKQKIVVNFHRYMPLVKPVIHAEVIAEVTTPMGRLITIYPNDDGKGADLIPNDGKYYAYFHDFDKSGIYNLLVYGRGTNETVVLNRTCRIRKGWIEIGPRDLTGFFTRINWGGQFHLNLETTSGEVFYRPGKILDIQIEGVSDINRTVQISWTAVGAQLFNGTASFYDIRIGNSVQSIRKNRFHEQMRITQDMILDGVNLSSPRSAGETERATIKLPSNIKKAYITVMAATSYKDKILYGESGALKYFSFNTKKVNEKSRPVQSTKPAQTRTTLRNSLEPSPMPQEKSTKPDRTIISPSNTAESSPQSITVKPSILSNTAKPSPKPPGKLNAGIISGIIIGCVTLVSILIGSVVWIVKKKTEHLAETVDENAVEQGNTVD